MLFWGTSYIHIFQATSKLPPSTKPSFPQWIKQPREIPIERTASSSPSWWGRKVSAKKWKGELHTCTWKRWHTWLSVLTLWALFLDPQHVALNELVISNARFLWRSRTHSASYRLGLLVWSKESAQRLVCCSYCYKRSLITTVIIIIAPLVSPK